jgi:hypothetical protein
MQSAEQVVPIGERLVLLARELTDDTNETYLLAHKALRALLHAGRSLDDAGLGDLRSTLLLAAQALGIAPSEASAQSAPAIVTSPFSAANTARQADKTACALVRGG